jgi:hypothetical protein
VSALAPEADISVYGYTPYIALDRSAPNALQLSDWDSSVATGLSAGYISSSRRQFERGVRKSTKGFDQIATALKTRSCAASAPTNRREQVYDR